MYIDEPRVADLISVSSDCYLAEPVSCRGVIAFRQPGLTNRYLIPVQIVTSEVGRSGPDRSSGAYSRAQYVSVPERPPGARDALRR